MSESKKPPLWKQLLGAIAGAAIALVLYEGYVVVTPKLTALVTLPTAPGVTQQTEVQLATDDPTEIAAHERLIRRLRMLGRRFSGPLTDAVHRLIGQDKIVVVPQGESPSPAPTQHAPRPVPPAVPAMANDPVPPPVVTSEVRAPAEAAAQAVESAQSSEPAPEQEPLAAEQPSEEAAEPPQPEAVVPQEPEAPAPEEPLEADQEIVPIVEESDVVIAPVAGNSERLPDSGFGLDLIAVAAAGAVLGRRRVQRRQK